MLLLVVSFQLNWASVWNPTLSLFHNVFISFLGIAIGRLGNCEVSIFLGQAAPVEPFFANSADFHSVQYSVFVVVVIFVCSISFASIITMIIPKTDPR